MVHLAARAEIAANDYPRLKAERDFYSNQMVELQTHNRVLTETPPKMHCKCRSWSENCSLQPPKMHCGCRNWNENPSLQPPEMHCECWCWTGSPLRHELKSLRTITRD